MPSPSHTLARQILLDSSYALTHHPFRATYGLVAGPVTQLCSASCGMVGKRMGNRLLGYTHPLPGPLSWVDRGLDQALLESPGQGSLPAQVQLFPDGGEALAALHNVIDQATCRIDIIMFQWEDDCVGRTIATWLATRAGPKLPVRILVDGGGNLMFGQPDNTLSGDVNRVVLFLSGLPNVAVIRTRNPFGWFDHRKLVVADGKWAWCGGRNFTYPSFFGQRDLSVTVAGPVVTKLAESFEKFWRQEGGKSQDQMATTGPFLANTLAHVVATAPGKPQLARAVYQAIDRAHHHIYLENFCVCDGRLLFKLARARHRGVDVRIVLTTSSTTGSVNHANHVIANRLLQAGVRVFLYPGMNHTKAAVMDGCWAYVGSGNFDALSFRRNRELGLILTGGPVIQELEEKLFEPDFCPAWELKEPLPTCLLDWTWDLLGSFFL